MPDPASRAVCLVRAAGRDVRELRPDQFGQIDRLLADPSTTVWLALTDPGPAELRLLGDEFGVHPLALEDTQKRGQRPKLDVYADHHMLVVYEALLRDDSDGFDLAELHVFAGRNSIVSVEWAPSPAVRAARGRFERHADASGGELLYALFDAAADSYFPVLDAMAERMDSLEDRVLAGETGSEGLREMLSLKRELLELRRVLGPMRDVANALLRRDVPIVDAESMPYFQDLYDHLVRLIDQLDVYRDLLASVLDARMTVTSNSLNAVMKRLTAITVLLMAPTLIAGIYGMNFVHMPELEWAWGYPAALGLMATAMLTAYVYFRRHDWF